jgi:hypothetical protein
MANSLSISSKYLPQDLLTDFNVKQAYVGKLGFVRLKLNKNLDDMNDSEEAALFNNYTHDFFSLLSKSPHIMEISPNEEELKKTKDYESFLISGDRYSIYFNHLINMRVTLPQRKSEELFQLFRKTNCPEQFSVYLYEGIFLAVSETKEVPTYTDIGQVTREFLVETLDDPNYWSEVEAIGPTPIHPEIYFLQVELKDNKTKLTNEFPIK